MHTSSPHQNSILIMAIKVPKWNNISSTTATSQKSSKYVQTCDTINKHKNKQLQQKFIKQNSTPTTTYTNKRDHWKLGTTNPNVTSNRLPYNWNPNYPWLFTTGNKEKKRRIGKEWNDHIRGVLNVPKLMSHLDSVNVVHGVSITPPHLTTCHLYRNPPRNLSHSQE